MDAQQNWGYSAAALAHSSEPAADGGPGKGLGGPLSLREARCLQSGSLQNNAVFTFLLFLVKAKLLFRFLPVSENRH